MGPLLKVENLTKHFPLNRGFLHSLMRRTASFVRAVDGLSFEVCRGEILGLAGESGCGKSTVGELLVRLQKATGGKILLQGQNIVDLRGAEVNRFRKRCQIIFQDPYSSLNPRHTILQAVAEPLKNFDGTLSRKKMQSEVCEALEKAELRPPENFLSRYPHQLSGGQRQRVAVARAIIANPEFMVADEPASMLDVSIRAGILNLLKKLKDEMGLSILYITHDLSTLQYLCNRSGIMYLGKIVEIGKTSSILTNPGHPYTQALMAAVPRLDPDSVKPAVHISGEIPSPVNIPKGCRFWPRCPKVTSICREEEPSLRAIAGEQLLSCHHPSVAG